MRVLPWVGAPALTSPRPAQRFPHFHQWSGRGLESDLEAVPLWGVAVKCWTPEARATKEWRIVFSTWALDKGLMQSPPLAV